MKELLEKQLRIMATFGVIKDRRFADFMKHLQAAAIGVVVEGAEVAAEMNRATRPWKPKDFDQIEPRLIEESIDVLFYLLEMWNMLGLSAGDINRFYTRKMYTNLRRVLSSVSIEKRREIVLGVAIYLNEMISTPKYDSFDHAKSLDATNYDYDIASGNPVASAVYLLLQHTGSDNKTLEKLIANPLDEA